MDSKRGYLFFVTAVLGGLSGTNLLLGQTGNGSVVGRITDPSGATIAGAEVTLKDVGTSVTRKTTTNDAGLYTFPTVPSGTYDLTVTHSGFRALAIPRQQVTVGQTLTLNGAMEVGAITETVEVTASPGAELQTLNATMGATIGGDNLNLLPTVGRDISSLLFVMPTAAPTFGGAEGNITSGNIAGAAADQNTYQLDGGNNTADLDGDNGTYVGHRAGAMPTPVESVEEFRVNTNNMTADFGSSAGGQVVISTKRGTNTFHGSAYDFFQGDWLNSNDWSNNNTGTPKPKAHYNRFGGSFGGPLLPKMLGGKTYFYTNYEGERYPRAGAFERAVPSDLLRQGIIQIRDASGNIVQYNLKTAAVCGTGGNLQCDPRGLGINPIVSKLWNSNEPEPNDFKFGDRLNTFGYRAPLSYPLTTDFGVVRVDHDFSDNWRFYSSYRYFAQNNPTTDQVDIGGVLPGDKLGVPATASTSPVEPRYFVAGLTTNIKPSLTNNFTFSYLRNFWQWLRDAAVPYVPGIPAAVAIGGDAGALTPLNVGTQATRPRLWNGHDFDYRDNLSWLKGTHFITFGGEIFHQWFHFDRYDNVVGGLTQLKYIIQNTGIQFSAPYQPVPCTATLTSNCLPASQLSNYRSLYSQVLGLVAQANIVATRTGSNLQLNPLGTPMASYSKVDNYSVYLNDAWRIKPNLTLNYGLNYSIQMPPYELNGAQDTLVANGQPINTEQYLANRQAAALSGQVYNPTLGFAPVGAVGRKYPYDPYYKEFAPRVSLAWNPNADPNTFWGKLLGNKATVIRGGYGRFYSKDLGINLVSTPVLGDGFLSPVSCLSPTMENTCTATNGSTPATAFRLGTDGNTVPLPPIAPTLKSPVEPGVNAPLLNYAFFLDNNYVPASTDEVDFSIQRQLKGNWLVEVGYVGTWARHLFQGIDLNDVPYMMKLGGQSFAQAYAGVATQLMQNAKTFSAQPFFEAALPASYCKGYANCTSAVAANEGSNISIQDVTTTWSDLESSFNFGPALLFGQANSFYGNASVGLSNYQALTATVNKRMSSGLVMSANFTYGHSLGTLGLNQSYTLNNVNDPWNLRNDWGPQFWDRKFTFNLTGSYTLPFGKGRAWANTNPVATRVLGGWTLSPVLSIASGIPLSIYTGSYDERGNGYYGNGCTAVPLSSMSYNNSPVYNVKSDGNIGVNGDYSQGGSGVNLFANPTAVYNNFRPYILGIDGNCGGGGILRGQPRWNLDLGLTKETRITERFGVQFFAQAFNVLNHMMWSDPSMNLQDPNNFGVLSGQYNAQTLGGFGAAANYTRIIQLGLRLSF